MKRTICGRFGNGPYELFPAIYDANISPLCSVNQQFFDVTYFEVSFVSQHLHCNSSP